MNMTNKQAFESIVVDLVPQAKENNEREIKQIEEELHILELLRKHIESYFYVGRGNTIELNMKENEEDFKEIFEWVMK